jgi:hypothetical protein
MTALGVTLIAAQNVPTWPSYIMRRQSRGQLRMHSPKMLRRKQTDCHCSISRTPLQVSYRRLAIFKIATTAARFGSFVMSVADPHGEA